MPAATDVSLKTGTDNSTAKCQATGVLVTGPQEITIINECPVGVAQ